MTHSTASLIVLNPDRYPPALRLLAWCALKTLRGQTVLQSVVNRVHA